MAKINFKVPTRFSTPLDIARGYIAAGIPVFPCREETQEGIDSNTGEIVTWAEKAPYTSNGLNGATTSHRIIDILFGDRHPNAAIGVPTGEALGAWVLDLDRHGDRDGHVWLAEMEALHGPLPPTGRATSANNGTHIFFKHVPGLGNRAAIAPGVDTRSTGGYVLAPGSVMADGRKYEWIDWAGDGLPPLADTPQWLVDLLKPKVQPAAPRQEYTYTAGKNEPYIEKAVEAELATLARTTQGGRGYQLNASAFSLGTLVGAGALSRSEAEAGLYDAATACGVAQKDGERETRAKIKRGLDAGIRQPREIPEREGYNDNTPPMSPEKIRAMVDNSVAKKVVEKQAERAAADNTPAHEPPADTPTTPRVRPRFEKTWFDEIKEGEPKEMFIKGAFGVREFTTVSGLPGTGKSVIVTDAACHVAAGMEWHGRKVKQGLVIYVAAERKSLTERRMMAFRKHHNVKDVPLLVIGGRLDFTKDLKDARDLIKEIKNAEIETGQQCVWVIVDTLTRVFGAGDQNASKDMSRFVQACDEILAETTAHVTAIHHSAWSGERGKGAIDLDGAVDASFMVKKDHGKYKLVCDGANDGEEGDVITFLMQSVTLGHDDDGEPTTAPVVVLSAGDDAAKGLVEAKTHKDKAMAILKDMQGDGTPTPGGKGFPEAGNMVPEESWRQAVYDMMGDATQPTKQATYARIKKSLLKYKDIGEQGQWVWSAK